MDSGCGGCGGFDGCGDSGDFGCDGSVLVVAYWWSLMDES